MPREQAKEVYLETTGGIRKTGLAFGLGTATEPVIGPVSEPAVHPSHPQSPETRTQIEELRAQVEHLTEVQRTQAEELWEQHTYIRDVEERHRAQMEELRQSMRREFEGLF